MLAERDCRSSVESSCATVRKKSKRMMLVKLRGGTAPFQIEIGRWKE